MNRAHLTCAALAVALAGCSANKALDEAVSGRDAQGVKKALARGADPNRPNASGNPLLCAVLFAPERSTVTPGKATAKEIVDALLEKGAKPDVTCAFTGGTPLLEAAKNHYPGAVKALVAHGADVDASDAAYPVKDVTPNDERPLFAAACKGDAAAVEVLLNAHADKSARNDGAHPGAKPITALQCARFKAGASVDLSRTKWADYPRTIALLDKP